MGYRSNVALVTTRKGLDMVREAWNSADGEYYVNLDADAEIVELGENHLDGVAILWEDVKWYGGAPEVEAVEELIVSDDFDEPYSFVRVGEEMGDCEHHYSVDEGGGQCPEELMCYPEMFIEIFDGCKRRMLLPHLDEHRPITVVTAPARLQRTVRVEARGLEPELTAKLEELAEDARESLCNLSDGEFEEVARLMNAATGMAFDYCSENSVMYPPDADGVPCKPGDWVRYCTDESFDANRYEVVAVGGDTVYYTSEGGSLPTSCAISSVLRHDEKLTPRRFLEWFGNVVTTVTSPDEMERLYMKAENALYKVQM